MIRTFVYNGNTMILHTNLEALFNNYLNYIYKLMWYDTLIVPICRQQVKQTRGSSYNLTTTELFMKCFWLSITDWDQNSIVVFSWRSCQLVGVEIMIELATRKMASRDTSWHHLHVNVRDTCSLDVLCMCEVSTWSGLTTNARIGY